MKYHNKKIIFICESSSDIGLGHLMRCSALSKYFLKNKWKSTLLTSRVDNDIRKSLKNSFTKIILNKTNEQKLLQNIILDFDFVLIDDYNYPYNIQMFLKNNINTIVFDDYPHRKIACHFLVDPTLGRKSSDYKNFVLPKCKILTGTKFIQLRESFQKENIVREDFYNYRKLPILVFIGGGNNLNLIFQIIKTLYDSKINNTIYLICSKEEKIEIEKLSYPNKINFFYSLDDKELYNLFKKVSLVIGGSGSSCWERCVMGLPSVIIPISENQKKISYELNLKNAAISIEKKDISLKLIPAIKTILFNEDNYLKMSKNASSICDGYGIKRLYEIFTRH